jgi:hypothetical protein
MRFLLVLPLLGACVATTDTAAPVARSGPPPSIATAEDAENYVLSVVAQNGCTLSLDAFDARRAADGLLPGDDALRGPGGLAKLQQASLIDAAPFTLIEKGLLVADPSDPRLVTSRGPGCA